MRTLNVQQALQSSGSLSTVLGGAVIPRAGVPAADALLAGVADIAVDSRGNIYMVEPYPVGRVLLLNRTTGSVFRVLGGWDAAFGDAPDGSNALSVKLTAPHGIALGPDGRLHAVEGTIVMPWNTLFSEGARVRALVKAL